jgi:hypothetical protein
MPTISNAEYTGDECETDDIEAREGDMFAVEKKVGTTDREGSKLPNVCRVNEENLSHKLSNSSFGVM